MKVFGDGPLDRFGYSIAYAWDVNGDGVGDIVVGAPENTSDSGGYVRVLSGRDGATLFTAWGDCLDLNGDCDLFGWSVSAVRDLDGDGRPQAIGGSPLDDIVGLDSGSAAILKGNGVDLHRLTGTLFDSSLFGNSVLGMEDLNKDLAPDVIIGAPADDSACSGCGRVFIFSGRDGSLIDHLDGIQTSDSLGWSLCRLEDVNHDGVDDFVVGARALFAPHGRAILVSGADRKVLLEFSGDAKADGFGTSVSDAGDVDKDGIDDVIIGSPDYTLATPGKAVLFSGANGAKLRTFDGEAPRDAFGWSVAGAGDVNGDGYPDQLVGIGLAFSGYAKLYSGKTGALLYRFAGPAGAWDLFGEAVAGVGDLNRDGYADIAIGAPNGGNGSVTVFLGNDLYLNAQPRIVSPATPVTLVTREAEPGQPALLVINSVNGLPIFVPVLTGTFDATGSWIVSGTAPPGLTGFAVSFRAYARTSTGRIIDTANELIEFN
jgi:FG-GAP repeat